ncbi:MAG: hypothetical protein D6799_08185 [Bacteroidetes bacterium]|nr:MAG: hypothetical protein D6799_08185 [Bacteroidota bacterium]
MQQNQQTQLPIRQEADKERRFEKNIKMPPQNQYLPRNAVLPILTNISFMFHPIKKIFYFCHNFLKTIWCVSN